MKKSRKAIDPMYNYGPWMLYWKSVATLTIPKMKTDERNKWTFGWSPISKMVLDLNYLGQTNMMCFLYFLLFFWMEA